MDIGVAVSDAEAAILSWLVEVYIGLHMCTSIRAISERILLRCSLTSAPAHHASRRWIVENAIAAMHDAMQDEAGSDPRGHLGVTWGVYLCAGKPPLADIILSHPPDLT